MLRSEWAVCEVAFIARDDDLCTGFRAGRCKIPVFKVSILRGVQCTPKRCPVHGDQLKERFQRLEKRPWINAVMGCRYVPTGRNRSGGDKAAYRSAIHLGEKF